MCIAVFMWLCHPIYPFFLLFNRDEYHNRNTKALGWWKGGEILGGQDEIGGGTWLACSRHGRVAFLTNVLETHRVPGAKPRGHIIISFLESKKSPKTFAEELAKEANGYKGFNLIVADLVSKSMAYVSNKPTGSIHEVGPGIHVLSNANLYSPCPKAKRLEQKFKQCIWKYGEGKLPVKEIIHDVMRDTIKAGDIKVPHTCCNLNGRFDMSSIFVEIDTPLGKCGTRSIAALTVKKNGESSFYETSLENGTWDDKTVNFQISN